MHDTIENVQVRTMKLGVHLGYAASFEEKANGRAGYDELNFTANRFGVSIYASKDRLIAYFREAVRQLEGGLADDDVNDPLLVESQAETVDLVTPAVDMSDEPATAEFERVDLVRVAS